MNEQRLRKKDETKGIYAEGFLVSGSCIIGEMRYVLYLFSLWDLPPPVPVAVFTCKETSGGGDARGQLMIHARSTGFPQLPQVLQHSIFPF